METEQTESEETRRERRPNYPAINLEAAVDRARVLLDREGKHFAPFEAIVEHWGYSVKSSGGRLAVAALKKFGLLEEQRSGPGRAFRLSPLALRILLDERPGSSERSEALREAALLPPIHAELWRKYEGSIPSDATLKYYLRLHRGLSERAAADLLREFKHTVEFAAMAEDGDQAGIEAPPPAEGSPGTGHTATPLQQGSPAQASEAQGRRAVHLPLSPGTWATLEAPFPLSEDAWRLMMAVLNAMKPGLTEGTREAAEDALAARGDERWTQDQSVDSGGPEDSAPRL